MLSRALLLRAVLSVVGSAAAMQFSLTDGESILGLSNDSPFLRSYSNETAIISANVFHLNTTSGLVTDSRSRTLCATDSGFTGASYLLMADSAAIEAHRRRYTPAIFSIDEGESGGLRLIANDSRSWFSCGSDVVGLSGSVMPSLHDDFRTPCTKRTMTMSPITDSTHRRDDSTRLSKLMLRDARPEASPGTSSSISMSDLARMLSGLVERANEVAPSNTTVSAASALSQSRTRSISVVSVSSSTNSSGSVHSRQTRTLTPGLAALPTDILLASAGIVLVSSSAATNLTIPHSRLPLTQSVMLTRTSTVTVPTSSAVIPDRKLVETLAVVTDRFSRIVGTSMTSVSRSSTIGASTSAARFSSRQAQRSSSSPSATHSPADSKSAVAVVTRHDAARPVVKKRGVASTDWSTATYTFTRTYTSISTRTATHDGGEETLFRGTVSQSTAASSSATGSVVTAKNTTITTITTTTSSGTSDNDNTASTVTMTTTKNAAHHCSARTLRVLVTIFALVLFV